MTILRLTIGFGVYGRIYFLLVPFVPRTDGLSKFKYDRRIGTYGTAFLDVFSSACDKVISMGSRPSPESWT